jgi:hypothetical protein
VSEKTGIEPKTVATFAIVGRGSKILGQISSTLFKVPSNGEIVRLGMKSVQDRTTFYSIKLSYYV